MQGEAKEAANLYPRMIKDALDEGRLDAAETLTIAMDREQHHLEVFSRALEILESKQKRLAAVAQIEGHVEHHAPARFESPPRIEAYPEASPAYRAAARELDREKWRVAAFGRIREVVFGAQDGLLSTVALVTAVAVSGVGGTTGVLVAGLAAALAGMVSMASGSYLSSKAEGDVQKAEIAKEAEELEAHPAEEVGRVGRDVPTRGLDHAGSPRHGRAHRLRQGPVATDDGGEGTGPQLRGVPPTPIKDALVMGLAFIVAAMVPITPFFFLDGYHSHRSFVGRGSARPLHPRRGQRPDSAQVPPAPRAGDIADRSCRCWHRVRPRCGHPAGLRLLAGHIQARALWLGPGH